MSQAERLAKLSRWLASPQGLHKPAALRELEISPSTFKRELEFLRSRRNMPIRYDAQTQRYHLDAGAQLPGGQYELPGLWLSAEEIHALLTMQHLLGQIDSGGLLGPHIQPLMKRLTQLLARGTEAEMREQLARRIRMQTVGARKVTMPHFQTIGSALLQRRRLVIEYHARGRDEVREREVSPQRLIHYRDNWYLDAWCHWRDGLRSFSVDAIGRAQALQRQAIDVPDAELDEVLGAGYGIFAGRHVHKALLRFDAERARWVAAETWHPNQRGQYDAQGRWILELPYADPRELVMDILRHMPHVEVLGPAELETMVAQRLREGLAKLGGLDE